MDLEASTSIASPPQGRKLTDPPEGPSSGAAGGRGRGSFPSSSPRAHSGRRRAGKSGPFSWHPVTDRVHARIKRQVRLVAEEVGKSYYGPPFDLITFRAAQYLAGIARRVHARKICLDETVRCSPEEPAPVPRTRRIRLGVFPVAGNPLHWGHLLSALRAMSEIKLDKVVFVVQGIDRRKALASAETQYHRHAAAKKSIAILGPLAAYSSIGLNNSATGEENLFRFLRLNADRRINAFYLVGSDHYRYTDSVGRLDTLPLLERYQHDPRMCFDELRHRLSVVFLLRARRPPELKSSLRILFLPEAIHASSSNIRRGKIELAPFEVLEYLRRHRDYASRIGFPAQSAATSRRRPAGGLRFGTPNDHMVSGPLQ
jgi:nicotinic acid mononucleotide adenylyltransferase